MKVLLFSRAYPEYMVSLANALSNYVEEVILMLPSGFVDNTLTNSIALKVVYKPYKIVYHKSLRDNFKLVVRLIFEIRKLNPDILHIQDNGLKQFDKILPLIPKRIKIVNTIHDPEKHLGDHITESMPAALNACKRRTLKYLVHGKFLKGRLLEAYHLPAEKIEIVKHGNLALYKLWAADDKLKIKLNKISGKKILFFGRILQYKGLNHLLNIYPQLKKQMDDVHLIVAGRGDKVESYLPTIESYPEFTNLNYRLTNGEVKTLFEIADVVVLPYMEATQSGVIPLSLAFGKPVIATKVGSIPEVFENGKEGFLVDKNDEKALTGAIIKVLTDKTLYNMMSKSALQLADKDLSWDAIAKKTFNIYKSL